MRIHTRVYEQIMYSMPSVPPESGGIIGMNQNGLICDVWFDKGIECSGGMVYQPNIERMNEIIAAWQEKGIIFSGIFHSHRPGNEFLSLEDLSYVRAIMYESSPIVNELYFPVVIPQIKIVPYLALREDGGEIAIIKKEIKII